MSPDSMRSEEIVVVYNSDSLLQNHIEGYHELSSKTQIYFSTAVAKWDADFYIKVDDDVHVNLGLLPYSCRLFPTHLLT